MAAPVRCLLCRRDVDNHGEHMVREHPDRAISDHFYLGKPEGKCALCGEHQRLHVDLG